MQFKISPDFRFSESREAGRQRGFSPHAKKPSSLHPRVSAWDAGQPRQCMPMPIRTGATSGLVLRISPIVISFVICVIVCYLLEKLVMIRSLTGSRGAECLQNVLCTEEAPYECRSPDVNFKVPCSFFATEFRPVYDTVVSIISKLFPKRKGWRRVRLE